MRTPNFTKLIFLFRVFIASSLFTAVLPAEENYKYQVSVCAIFREDARFLKEWIEFHRMVGVEHFWLFNNLSKDDYGEVLDSFIADGIVDLIDWPYESVNWRHWHEIQNTSYDQAITLAAGKTKWLAIIDTDEFLFPVKAGSLAEVLMNYEGFGGVAVNWQMFGTSHVKRIPDDRLMIELLICKAEENYPKNLFIKSIVRPERVKCFPSAHFPKFRKGFFIVDTDGNQVFKDRSQTICIDQLRINHYWTRDEDFFFERKVGRRDKPGSNFNEFLKEIDELNACQDSEILRFAPALNEAVFGLLSP